MGNNVSVQSDNAVARGIRKCGFYYWLDVPAVIARQIFATFINAQAWINFLFLGRPLWDHTTRNRWLHVNINRRHTCESCGGDEVAVIRDYTIDYYNMENVNLRITRDGNRFPPKSNEEFVVFYHATTRDSAEHIISNGIKLQKGRRWQDFSNGRGFYLATDYHVAMTKARSIRQRLLRLQLRPRSAIIVFRIDRITYNNYNRYHLVGQEWKDVIRYNRCRRDCMDSIRWEEIDRTFYDGWVDCLEGNMCLNPSRLDYEAPVTRGVTNQICILCDPMARFVGCPRHITVLFQET